MNNTKWKTGKKILKVLSLAAILAILPVGMSMLPQTAQMSGIGIETHAASYDDLSWVKWEVDSDSTGYCQAMKESMAKAIRNLPSSMRQGLEYYGLTVQVRNGYEVWIDNSEHGAGITHQNDDGSILIGMAAAANVHIGNEGERLHSCYHELGHAVSYLIYQNGQSSFYDTISTKYQEARKWGDFYLNDGYYNRFKSVHGYGYTSTNEYFAEVFAGYMMGEEDRVINGSRLSPIMRSIMVGDGYKWYFLDNKLKDIIELQSGDYKTHLGSKDTMYMSNGSGSASYCDIFYSGVKNCDIYVTDANGNNTYISRYVSNNGGTNIPTLKPGRYTITGIQRVFGEVFDMEKATLYVVPSITNSDNQSTLSKTSAVVGDNITVKCQIKSSQDQKDMLRTIYITAPGETKAQQVSNYVSQNTLSSAYPNYSFKADKIGEYKVRIVYLSDAGEKSSKTLKLTVKGKPANISKVSNQTINANTLDQSKIYAAKDQKVYVQAKSQNISSKELKNISVFLKEPDGTWVKKAEYQKTANTYAFKPSKTGTYCIKVVVQDTKGNKLNKEFKVICTNVKNISSVSATAVKVGESVKINCSTSNGTAPYTYTLYCKRPTDTEFKPFLSNVKNISSTSYSFSEAGQYQLKVRSVDNRGCSVYKTFTITVTDPLKNTSAVRADTPAVNSKIVLTAKAIGGKPAYTYAFYYKEPGQTSWTTLKTYKDSSGNSTVYSSASQMTYTPTKAGTYQFRINVKDSDGEKANQVFTIRVQDISLTNQSTVNKNTVALNQKVKVTGQSIGGTGTHKYAFYYQKPNSTKWIAYGTEYDKTTSVSIPLTLKGVYKIRVDVKDSTDKVVSKTITVNVISDNSGKA